LWTQTTLTHFFDSDESVAKQGILSFIDRAKPPFAYLAENTVAPLKQVIGNKKPSK